MDVDFGQVPTELPVAEEFSCGVPTEGILNGLPALPCGEFFDVALDSQLGYYSTDLVSAEV